jgi:peptide/nickel transport system substrate-binding protein
MPTQNRKAAKNIMRSEQLIRLLLLLVLLGGAYWTWNKFFKIPELPDATLVIRTDMPATNLNPLLSNGSGGSLQVAKQIFPTLADYDLERLEQLPVLIKSIPNAYTLAEGPHKGCIGYDFELLEEARWDNGTPVTGNDVAFSIKIVLNPKIKTQFRPYYSDFKAIETDAANPKKFKVFFAKPYILALETLCQTPIYPAYHYDAQQILGKFNATDLNDPAQAATLAQNPDLAAFAAAFEQDKYKNDPASVVSCGPYRVEVLDEQHCILVKKDGWWGDALAATNPMLTASVKRIEYKVVPDETAAENLLRNGQLDVVAGSLSAGNFVKWKNDATLAAAFDFKTLSTTAVSRWFFNCSSPKLDDYRVRQALAHLVNYDYLINTVSQGFAQRTVGVIHPSKAYYAKDIVPYPFSIDKARALLAEAGWKDTNGDGTVDKVIGGRRVDFKIEIMGPQSSGTVKGFLPMIKENAKQAGIQITDLDATMDLMAQKAGGEVPNFDSGLGTTGISPAPYDFFDRYHSASIPPAGNNRNRFKNTELDSLIMLHRSSTDLAQQKNLFIRIQEILYHDVPEVYLQAPVQRVLVSKKWEAAYSATTPGYAEARFAWKPLK